jgi:hypothetical protein
MCLILDDYSGGSKILVGHRGSYARIGSPRVWRRSEPGFQFSWLLLQSHCIHGRPTPLPGLLALSLRRADLGLPHLHLCLVLQLHVWDCRRFLNAPSYSWAWALEGENPRPHSLFFMDVCVLREQLDFSRNGREHQPERKPLAEIVSEAPRNRGQSSEQLLYCEETWVRSCYRIYYQ